MIRRAARARKRVEGRRRGLLCRILSLRLRAAALVLSLKIVHCRQCERQHKNKRARERHRFRDSSTANGRRPAGALAKLPAIFRAA